MTTENKFKGNTNNWLNIVVAVTIAIVALLGSFITKAQSEASSAASLASNKEQEKYYQAIGRQISGEADGSNAFGTEYQLWYRYNIQLTAAAQRDDQAAVKVFTGLRDTVEKTSTSRIFAPEYFDKTTARVNLARYKADLYIRDLYLLEEEQQAASEVAAAWGDKDGTYGLQLTLLVVAGFLLGLALMTNARLPTFVFTASGIISVVVISVWAYAVASIPVTARPPAALQAFAEGASFTEQGRWDEALLQFTTAIKTAEEAGVDYPRAYLHRAQVYAALQDFQKAIADYEVAQAMGLADDPTLNNSLVAAYFQIGDFKKALTVGLPALEASPDDLTLRQQVAMAYLAGGELDLATQMNNSLLSKAEALVEAQERLGDSAAEVWWLLTNAGRQYDFLIEALQGENAISTNIKDKEAVRKAAEGFIAKLRAQALALKYNLPEVSTAAVIAKVGTPKFIIETTADKKYTYKVGLRFHYKDILPGQILSISVYRNKVDDPSWGFSQPWASQQAEGTFNLTLSPSFDNFYIVPAGFYAVDIYVNDKLVSQGEFSVGTPDELNDLALSGGGQCDPLNTDAFQDACSGDPLALTEVLDWSNWPELSADELLYYDCLYYPEGPFCQFLPDTDSDGDTVPDYFDACPYQPGSWYDYGCPASSNADIDGDGISNFDDYCPFDFGFAENYGCPMPSETDWDGDGVQDVNDLCIDLAGPADNGGCPLTASDADGDNLPDTLDACPLDYGLGADGCPEPTANDTDGDTVSNADDLCPDQSGPAENSGCPLTAADTDGDTVPDEFDACPQDYGLGEDGCPQPTAEDVDGDGILNADDACPDQPGPVDNGGCPVTALDSDGDTVPDDVDLCPADYGTGANGCPQATADDTDGDGVLNVDDACPDQPGPATNGGCPDTAATDTDGDGTPDASDDCPADYGPADNFGCPIADVDTDGDGIFDAYDACPYDYSTEPDGCPITAPDRDGDGVPDDSDACPDDYGTEPDGCPTPPAALVPVTPISTAVTYPLLMVMTLVLAFMLARRV